MARLVCPHCKTPHRVSVVQPAYRELPCKCCGRPLPLAVLDETPHAGSASLDVPSVPRDPEVAAPAPAASPAAGALAAAPAGEAPGPADLPAKPAPGPVPPLAPVVAFPAPPALPLACPRCGRPLHPRALKCPGCRRHLPGATAGEDRRSSPVLVAAAALLLLALAAVVALWLARARVP